MSKDENPSPVTQPIGFMDVEGLRTLVGDVRARPAGSPPPQDLTPTRQYYYRQNGCKAINSDDPDCICWHDEGTGPYANEPHEPKTWRERPVPHMVWIEEGIERAARYIEKQRDDYVQEFGNYDPSTGVTEFSTAGEEHLSTLEELIEGIRALHEQAPASVSRNGGST